MIACIAIVFVVMPFVLGMVVVRFMKVKVSLTAFMLCLPISMRMGQRRRLASDVRTDEQDGQGTPKHDFTHLNSTRSAY